ncbi:MAG: transposase [Dehalococcoidia bacterium]
MRYDPFRHNRRSIRLPGYDYTAAGSYFVTINAVHGDASVLFGTIIEGGMVLNEYGEIVRECWQDLPSHYDNVVLDAFVVMPNHVHGIIVLVGEPDVVGEPQVGAGLKPAPTTSVPVRRCHGLPEIVRGLKTFSSRRINVLRETEGTRVWQRNYYEHIVGDEKDLARIRAYIEDNPRNWEDDEYHV